MNKVQKSQNITELDLHFASLIFPILTEFAPSGVTLTYSQVKTAVQDRYPDSHKVGTMHHRHVGRRLGAIWEFTKSHRRGCPHIGAMVVLQATGECSDGFDVSLDPKKEREKCRTFNWDEVNLEFERYMKKAKSEYKRSIKPKKKKKPEVARFELSEHWKSAEVEFEALSVDLKPSRNMILKEIESGESAPTAIAHAIQNLFKTSPEKLPKKSGFVYVGEYRLANEDEPLVKQVKIGTTTRELEVRAHEIGGGVEGPISFVVTHAWKFDRGNAVIAEQLLHGEFSEYRQRGEFFDDMEDILPELTQEFIASNFSDAVQVRENGFVLEIAC